MFKNPLLVNRHFREFNPVVAGEENCASGHSFGPAVRKYTLVHYVISGSGTLFAGGQVYPVHAGEAFVILPGEVTVYTASESEPWFYRWIGFDGELSGRFANAPRVITPSPRIFETIGEALMLEDMREYRLCAALFELYADVFSGKSENHHYVRRIRDFVRASYMQHISVKKIAEGMNLDRRYLTRIFKERTGQTIQDYIITVRLEAARERLLEGATVSEAAMLCGYEDVCNFSKMFKRRYGVSPGRWKRQGEG